MSADPPFFDFTPPAVLQHRPNSCPRSLTAAERAAVRRYVDGFANAASSLPSQRAAVERAFGPAQAMREIVDAVVGPGYQPYRDAAGLAQLDAAVSAAFDYFVARAAAARRPSARGRNGRPAPPPAPADAALLRCYHRVCLLRDAFVEFVGKEYERFGRRRPALAPAAAEVDGPMGDRLMALFGPGRGFGVSWRRYDELVTLVLHLEGCVALRAAERAMKFYEARKELTFRIPCVLFIAAAG